MYHSQKLNLAWENLALFALRRSTFLPTISIHGALMAEILQFNNRIVS